nr:UvrABC system protein C [Chlamydiota bacterium]
MTFDAKTLVHFPTGPGVYLMLGAKKKVLYIGKAKNLKVRVKQYFLPHGDGRAMIPLLTAQITSIDYIIVSSEKESLLLENTLIKKHRPKYNALLKDDKTYFSLAINHKHRWPMVRIVRYKGKPPANALYFGPFTRGYAARQTLELLRSLFPLRQCSDRELQSRCRPCILYEMKKCVAPCVSKCTKEEYATLVKQVIEFLRGHDAGIIKELHAQMETAADSLDFEKAEALLQTIHHIETTIETQRVQKAGMKDFDALGLYREADRVLITQMLFREGKLTGSYNHFFSHIAQEDTE